LSSEKIGRVVNVVGRNRVTIAVNEDKLVKVSKPGVYVKIPVFGVTLFGVVTSFSLSDELYRASRIVEEFEGYGEFRLSRNEILVTLVGSMDEHGNIKRGIPLLPRPGDHVELVDTDTLKRVFESGDVEIGRLNTNSDVRVFLDINKLCSRHLAILAMTGAGKSNALAVILGELLKKFPYARVLLIDTHSEYVSMAKTEDFNARVFTPLKPMIELLENQFDVTPQIFEVPYWVLSLDEWYSLLRLDTRATKQRMYLRDGIRKIKRELDINAGANDPLYFDINELISKLKSGRKDASLEDLLNKMEELLEDDEKRFITEPEETKDLLEDLKRGYLASGHNEKEAIKRASYDLYYRLAERVLKEGLNIVALGGLSGDTQDAITSTILRMIWRLITNLRYQGVVWPTMIVLEEAHNYAPSGRYTASRGVVETLAKEGRKFGICLVIISQRPRELSETVLAQCGNLIALRTVNPADQNYIISSLEEVNKEIIEDLPGLETGEAIVSGPAIRFPAIVQVYNFKERFGIELGGKDIDFRTHWMHGAVGGSFGEEK